MIFLSLVYKNKNTTAQKSAAQEVSPTSITQNSIQIGDFTFSWFQTNTDSLKLIPNFDEKNFSKEVIQNNKCRFLSNAGFYSKESKPIGLFVTDKQTLSNWQENLLLDGILSINDIATPRITREAPKDTLRIALQTGPIVKENAGYVNLKIQNDSEARRVIAGVTGENKLFFLVIYKTNSEYLGPLLGDLPVALKKFEEKSGIIFADIINLDGGAASTFYSPDKNLSEINSTGAFFCQL